MIKAVAVLLVSLALVSCGTTKLVEKPIEYTRPPLIIQNTESIVQRDITWHIITNDTYLDKITLLGDNTALVALTVDDYERLSLNLAELRAFIWKQKLVIEAYKSYYKKREE
jgi:hypothetical protein